MCSLQTGSRGPPSARAASEQRPGRGARGDPAVPVGGASQTEGAARGRPKLPLRAESERGILERPFTADNGARGAAPAHVHGPRTMAPAWGCEAVRTSRRRGQSRQQTPSSGRGGVALGIRVKQRLRGGPGVGRGGATVGVRTGRFGRVCSHRDPQALALGCDEAGFKPGGSAAAPGPRSGPQVAPQAGLATQPPILPSLALRAHPPRRRPEPPQPCVCRNGPSLSLRLFVRKTSRSDSGPLGPLSVLTIHGLRPVSL